MFLGGLQGGIGIVTKVGLDFRLGNLISDFLGAHRTHAVLPQATVNTLKELTISTLVGHETIVATFGNKNHHLLTL